MNRTNLDKEHGAGLSTPTKITIVVALIGAAATILAAALPPVINSILNSSPSSSPPTPTPPTTQPVAMPPPTCPTCGAGGKTFTEQSSLGSPKPTYRDPRTFTGEGPSVQPGEQIEVVCRFLDPNAPASVQPGWWYLIASPPWNREYYTVANSYLNGDPPGGPFVTDVDTQVPVC